ncbi:myotubularin-related protein 3 isoform X2 [Alosa sapidissima]|uniref:myotubularin-related protein 3 isoform X2 n=1 Tax=Alosa sapidissima TaxID=34773 RepID=UPI001C08B24E|nr:myotubularin-related protein 3 isoform X2 [Alosa sapidissima]
MDEEDQQSPEAGKASLTLSRKSPVLEEDNLQVPFSELHGECVEYVGRAEDAIIAMSSYRLHINFKESVINVPLQLIESVECRDMFQLQVICKDCKVIRCQFAQAEQCQDWLKRLGAVARPPAQLEQLFAFSFHVHTDEQQQPHNEICRAGDHVTSRFKNEVERMGFDMDSAWRISEINRGFRLCSSYPELLLVPASVTDKELENVAAFRSWKRFPVVVYRHQSTGAVIGRCGQPEVSWWGWRSAEDEQLVQAIAKACTSNGNAIVPLSNGSCGHAHTNGTNGNADPVANGDVEAEPTATPPEKLLILDARSYAAAVANRAKGGGCECPEYYPNCEVVFMGMANIHSIRKSFQCLRSLCAQVPDPANWLSALESTKWLQHLSLLLKAALLVINAVDRDRRPVLVHCSDGWDRTPQIVALSKLLLDPFYRTIEGFQVLVETEWLDFGHKFADRCGHGEKADDLNERCPVFLQWLDCVHQLQRQFPCSFQFNEAFLVKLVQHTYSCLFGTFLCNSGKEREESCVQQKTCSVWSLMRPAHRAFRNILYSPHSETVLHPVCHVRNLMVWSAVYLPGSSPSTPCEESCAPYPAHKASSEDTPNGRLPKTRSVDDLPLACEGGPPPSRRCSDPNLRALEIAMATSPDGNECPNGLDDEASLSPEQPDSEMAPEERPDGEEPSDRAEMNEEPIRNGHSEEAGLSMAEGVAPAQMEHILQEAREEVNGAASSGPLSEDISEDFTPSTLSTPTPSPSEASSAVPAPADRQDPITQLCEEMVEQALEYAVSEPSPPPRVTVPLPPGGHMTNGHCDGQAEEPLTPPPGHVEDGGGGGSELSSAVQPEAPHCPLETAAPAAHTPPHTPPQEEPQTQPAPPEPPRTLNGLRLPSHGALHPLPSSSSPSSSSSSSSSSPSPAAAVCNGETHPVVNGSRRPLSRQASGTSPCGGLPLPRRASGLVPRARGEAAATAAAPPAGHLEEDGLSVHSDAVQVRLQQMEAGHQLQVENLKWQVQQLWSRLRVNVELPSELTSLPDGENNLEPVCLSRCSSEFFSEGSWEQVEQREPEMTRWYPDHLATHCYGCETKFWLAARKHHCRNCGNVFCASCCDQKVAVPNQQLFEPNRVCKACYGHLRLTSVPPADLELEKPITASSN